QRGASGSVPSQYAGASRSTTEPIESTAWIAKGVRYVDRPTADPPNATLTHLARRSLIVWAVIYSPPTREPPLELDVARAGRNACGEGVGTPAEYELSGSGPRHAYAVIVRIYFGSPPTRPLRAEAQRALDALALPGVASSARPRIKSGRLCSSR